MYCSKCGKRLLDDSNFCDGCGARLNVNPASNIPVDTPATILPTCQPEAEIVIAGAEVARAGAEVASARAEMTKTGAEAATSEVSPKSRLAATLLAFFVGGFGAHRFYLGKNGSAAGMLALTIVGIIIAIATGDISGFVFLPILALGRAVRFGVSFIPILAVGIWAFVDFIVIVSGHMKDSKGRRVKKWR